MDSSYIHIKGYILLEYLIIFTMTAQKYLDTSWIGYQTLVREDLLASYPGLFSGYEAKILWIMCMG